MGLSVAELISVLITFRIEAMVSRTAPCIWGIELNASGRILKLLSSGGAVWVLRRLRRCSVVSISPLWGRTICMAGEKFVKLPPNTWVDIEATISAHCMILSALMRL